MAIQPPHSPTVVFREMAENRYIVLRKSLNLGKNYNLYENGSNGRAATECIPNLGYIPSHLPYNMLSSNPVDIESGLRGINSCNLVGESFSVKPELNTIDFKDFFHVNREIIMPQPLIHETGQRPFPV